MQKLQVDKRTKGVTLETSTFKLFKEANPVDNTKIIFGQILHDFFIHEFGFSNCRTVDNNNAILKRKKSNEGVIIIIIIIIITIIIIIIILLLLSTFLTTMAFCQL